MSEKKLEYIDIDFSVFPRTEVSNVVEMIKRLDGNIVFREGKLQAELDEDYAVEFRIAYPKTVHEPESKPEE